MATRKFALRAIQRRPIVRHTLSPEYRERRRARERSGFVARVHALTVRPLQGVAEPLDLGAGTYPGGWGETQVDWGAA